MIKYDNDLKRLHFSSSKSPYFLTQAIDDDNRDRWWTYYGIYPDLDIIFNDGISLRVA